MSMIVWTLLGLGLGLLASKIVSTTGEGTVVDILLGIVGAVVGGWLFNFFGGTGITGFDIGGLYSAGAAVIGAVILLALYPRLLPPPNAVISAGRFRRAHDSEPHSGWDFCTQLIQVKRRFGGPVRRRKRQCRRPTVGRLHNRSRSGSCARIKGAGAAPTGRHRR
jgi:uncharacterized membrane protein YeaQ/YmgE (transglycosylase-associated protein family)